MGKTFLSVGLEALDIREQDQVRSIASERLRFRKHLLSSAIARKPIEHVRPKDIADLKRALSLKVADDNREERKLSGATVNKIMQLTSSIFDIAVEQGLRDDNPCLSVRKTAATPSTKEPWDYLTKEEVTAIAECPRISESTKALILFAIYTGLRQGEQWNLHWDEVLLSPDYPSVIVRYGSNGLPPKNGKIRKVPLFGKALYYAKWLRARCKGYGPVFPSNRFTIRQPGAPEEFQDVLKQAGITRHIRWHDLRHTCGTALMNGYWGPSWNLIDIRDMLGHSSVKVTERYSHATQNRLQLAAAQMTG